MGEAVGVISNFKTFLESLYGAGVKKVYFGRQTDWDDLSSEEKNKFDAACTWDE